MYRVLPPFGADQRGVAEVVNGIMNGKTNNTGSVTLATGGASTTTITDARIGADSIIILVPADDVSASSFYPYLAVQDDTDQAATTTTAANIMSFTTTDYSLGASLANSTKLTAGYAGLYNIQFSAQLINTTNDVQEVSIWFRKNGTNVDESATQYNFPTNNQYSVLSWNFVISLNSGDYLEFVWASLTGSASSLQHQVAQTTPVLIPEVPSLIVTVTQV